MWEGGEGWAWSDPLGNIHFLELVLQFIVLTLEYNMYFTSDIIERIEKLQNFRGWGENG